MNDHLKRVIQIAPQIAGFIATKKAETIDIKFDKTWNLLKSKAAKIIQVGFFEIMYKNTDNKIGN